MFTYELMIEKPKSLIGGADVRLIVFEKDLDDGSKSILDIVECPVDAVLRWVEMFVSIHEDLSLAECHSGFDAGRAKKISTIASRPRRQDGLETTVFIA